MKRAARFANCVFVTVATILGTGILGLPIKLAKCGFMPFLLSFTVCLFMQISVALLMIELLQIAHARLRSEHFRSARGNDGRENMPDLHTMGNLFFPGMWMRRLFDLSVMLHFVAILVSYALGGPQAYGQLIGDLKFSHCNTTDVDDGPYRSDAGHCHGSDFDYRQLIAPFVICCAMFVYFGGVKAQAVISTLTVVKCTMLVVVIFVVWVVANKVAVEPTSSWSNTAEPFLIGTLALGGAVNILPVLYMHADHSRQGMVDFRTAITSGIVLCWCLNLAWCYFVLRIVPQTGELSLQLAAEQGEISTIPVVKSIQKNAQEFNFVAGLINCFISVSLTVSFCTLGIGMMHVLRGIADSSMASVQISESSAGHLITSRNSVAEVEADATAIGSTGSSTPPLSAGSPRTYGYGAPAAGIRRHGCVLWQVLPQGCSGSTHQRYRTLVASWFAAVLAMALLNPHAFLDVLEIFASLALNVEAGVCIAFMYKEASTGRIMAGEFSALDGGSQDEGDEADRRRIADSQEPRIAEVVAMAAEIGGENTGRNRDSDTNVELVSISPQARSSVTEIDQSGNSSHEEAAAALEVRIPLPLGSSLGPVLLRYVFISFGFAVIYDCIRALSKFIKEWSSVAWLTLFLVLAIVAVCYFAQRLCDCRQQQHFSRYSTVDSNVATIEFRGRADNRGYV